MPLLGNQIHPTMQTAALALQPNGSLNAGRLTLVFRIRQVRDGRLLKEHRLILMPATMVQETEARTSLYYTQGGIVADTPLENAIGATHFQIAGHTGFRGVQGNVTTLDPGAQGPERLVHLDGAAAIKDLQDTLFAYFFPQGGIETRAISQQHDLQLEFLNLTAPVSAEDPVGRVGWRIHPARNLISLRQEASRPFLYFYQLQFAAIGPLTTPWPDVFTETYGSTDYGLAPTLDKIDAVGDDVIPGPIIDPVTGLKMTPPATVVDPITGLRRLTQGVNTISATFDRLFLVQVVQPVATFLQETARLGAAVGNFIHGLAEKIRFPLYAQHSLLHALDAPRHSVTTLFQAAHDLRGLLYEATVGQARSIMWAGEDLVAGVNDLLTLRLNDEAPCVVELGSLSGGPAIAAALQTQVRTQAPQHQANAAAYRDFTATFAGGQYVLRSGTAMSDAARVEVVVNADPLLTPTDASAVLGLGLANGGQEQAGSAVAVRATHLLLGLEQACQHLQAFPDYFADQLEAQDAALAALLPTGMTRPQIRGDQHLRQMRITPGDTLQGMGARVGVPWETLALVNRLIYPFIFEEPTTLTQGRVSSAEAWSVVDVTRTWPVDAYQGQRVDIVAGIGAGQSRRILRNTPTTLVLETAWTVTPSDISDYAIRTATNPVQRTGTVSSATATTVTNGSLSLVPGSQRGLTLVVTSGPTAGDRRRVVANDETTYALDRPWDVLPTAGSLYLLLGPQPATFRQKVVGDSLGVPQPSAQTPLPIRTRLHDVSAITGQQRSVEERLFGRDLLLDLDTMALVWDPALGDIRTIAELPNLRQALVHYINLPLGELEYAPGLGSYVAETLGLSATLPLQIELLASVERTIRQDRRVARMTHAQLVGSGGTTRIAFGAQAVDGSTVDRIAIR